MKPIIPLAVLSALLAGCGSSGGGSGVVGGGGGGGNPPPASLTLVPTGDQNDVQTAKKISVDLLIDEQLELAIDANNLASGTTFNSATTLKIGNNAPVALGSTAMDFSTLPVGLWNDTFEINYDVSPGNTTGAAKGKIFAYTQPYSVVIGTIFSSDTNASGTKQLFKSSELNAFAFSSVFGRETTAVEIGTLNSNNVTATYTGVAFDHLDQGTLSYTMDFGNLTGSGSITGIARTGDITLASGTIATNVALNMGPSVQQGINGSITTSSGGTGSYKLGFYGPNAEEIGGFVEVDNDDDFINFSGVRP